MKARTTVAIVVLSLVLAISGLGCVALSKMITPADIDRGAVKYAVRGEQADPNEYVGWPSLAKAEALAKDVDAAHNTIQLRLKQAIETDVLDYSIHKDVVAASVEKGQALEGTLFGPEGLLSIGLTAMGVGGCTGLLGLMRRKPGDWAPEDVDAALNEAGLEGKIKGAQIIEIVKGIENLKAVLPEGVWDANKGKVSEKMSDATKEAVAVAKANL